MQVFVEKEMIPVGKEEQKWQMQDSLSRQNFKETRRAMSQPAAISRNKVQVEFKEEEELCGDKKFFRHNIAKEECEEDSRGTLYSVAT